MNIGDIFTGRNDNSLKTGLLVSIFLHVFAAIIMAAAASILIDRATVPVSYVNIYTVQKENMDDIKSIDEEMPLIDENLNSPEKKPETAAYFYDFNYEKADTSSLEQIYSEQSLNVRLRYPAGWTFIDQNRKNKLDGVTFWMAGGSYNPPPYVHLEVKEKYYFNPERFRYQIEMRNFTLYYNDPEEMEGQVSQIVYIRTETDEDYSMKLIMNGKESFRTFQTEFFAMIKSFRFGKSFF